MAGFLIVYASKYGSTERIATRLEAVLSSAGHVVTRHDVAALPAGFSPDRYDRVIVAAPVFTGSHPKPIRRFVTAHAAALNRLPGAFVSVCGAAASTEPRARAEAEGYASGFLRKTGWTPATVLPVAGTIAYTRYDPLTRFVLKLIARRNKGETDTSRDWEYTDWAAVDALASRLAAEAGGATPR